jgi:hypothetical protein
MNVIPATRMDPSRARLTSDRLLRKLVERLRDAQNCRPPHAQSGESPSTVSRGPRDRPTLPQLGQPDPPEGPRIRIDVPMGTSYREIQESIFLQVYEHAGTQLQAAIALGVTPETISRVLRRLGRRQDPGTSPPDPVMTSDQHSKGLPRGDDGRFPTLTDERTDA